MEQEKEQVSVELQLLNAKNSGAYNLTPAGQMFNQFAIMQRMGQMYSSSTIVPDAYSQKMTLETSEDGKQNWVSKNPAALGNCIIAIDMAQRMGANPIMVMQNLYIVHGNPSFSSKFLVATINASKHFSPLDYEFKGTQGQDDWGCRVVAYDINDRERKYPKYGDFVDIKMAKDEGWYAKSGSKWKTMPALMLRYRAAAFWQRVYCPEISMGLITKEEYEDAEVVYDEKPRKSLLNIAAEQAGVAEPTPTDAKEPEIATQTPSNGESSQSNTNTQTQEQKPSQDAKERKTLL